MKLNRHTLIVSLGLISGLVQAQTTLVSNLGASGFSSPGFPGQSFTTPNDGTSDLMVGFTWLDNVDAPMGAGLLYVFSAAYAGLPTGLASGGGLLGTSNTYASGSYSFTSAITLSPNTQYFVYSGTSQQVGRLAGDLAGESFYQSLNVGTNFSAQASGDATFIVTVTAIPEPSTYAAAAGLAALGLAAWRRRSRHALA